MPQLIYEIAVPTPLFRSFDYLPPLDGSCAEIGSRVKINFGRREVTGVVIKIKSNSDFDLKKLKPIDEVLDKKSLLIDETLRLAKWAIKYYHSYPGEILSLCFPTALRKGKEAKPKGETTWVATSDPQDFGRATRQKEIYNLIAKSEHGLTAEQLPDKSKDMAIIRQLVKRGSIFKTQSIKASSTHKPQEDDLSLNTEQEHAFNSICNDIDHYSAHLLFGITGSGKTEIFIQTIRKIIQSGKQALILVPEIGLTPQLVKRFTDRFSEKTITIHSEMSESSKLNSWLLAQMGEAKIIIGTRSALFTPMPDLGLIIVDEEHDLSFKQQDGIRYSARDMAVTRAHMRDIPVILSSATPSLESINNANSKRYKLLELTQRAGEASPPKISLIDIRSQKLHSGMSHQFLTKIKQHATNGGQVLIFLNRRGYAPLIMCHSCGWNAACDRCDVKLTLYQKENILKCQHCGYTTRTPTNCPDCGEKEMLALGKGTERVEEALSAAFPDLNIARIDRDTMQRKDSFNQIMKRAESGEIHILLGTQMLAKGHHLPNITLTGIIDIDSGLFSTDFRAIERMAQLLTQVAGRSGRGNKAGEVILQTHHPENPILHTILFSGYKAFSTKELKQRQTTQLPPYTSMAVIRAEAMDKNTANSFLESIKDNINSQQVEVFGPLPSVIHRRNRHYRSQLYFQSKSRSELQKLLAETVIHAAANKLGKKVRWHVDMDAQETI